MNSGPTAVLDELDLETTEPQPAQDVWQLEQMIGANPVVSVNLALMMGVVVAWLIKRR